MTNSPSLFDLNALGHDLRTRCTDCGACVAACPFLQETGSPGQLAANLLTPDTVHTTLASAFLCSLCGLCTSLCPERLRPADVFLAMRGEAARMGVITMRPYRSLLIYEALGRSRLFADRLIPPGCDTVLFPGCTFPGTHPETLRALVRHLCQRIPALGIVLDCCSKPSHDLGRHAFFTSAFASLCQDLLRRGIRRIVTVCPNCHSIFRQYGSDFETTTVTSWLAANGLPETPSVRAHAVLHIPCPLRANDREISALRQLASSKGLSLEPLKHKGRRSPCCGEGGAVSHVRPHFSATWRARCTLRAGERPLLTACAGCVQSLRGRTNAMHILDVLFFPRQTLAGSIPVHGPRTSLHRLLLRLRLRQP